MFAALIALQALCDPLYVAPAVFGPLAIVALWRLRAANTRRDGLRLAAALVAAATLLLPVYAGYADVARRNPNLMDQSVMSRWTPAADSTFPFWVHALGHLLFWWHRFPIPLLASIAMVVAVVVIRRSRPLSRSDRIPWLHCGLWMAFGLLLPVLRYLVPELRNVGRGGLVSLVAFALLAGLTFHHLGLRRGPRWAVAAALGTVLFVLAPTPRQEAARTAFLRYPIQPVPSATSDVVRVLRAGHGPVVELPAGKPTSDAEAVFRSISHRRPLLNGYGSYFPAAMPGRLELMKRLPEREALEKLRIETGVATIVLKAARLDAQQRLAWETVRRAAGSRSDLRPVLDDGDIAVFEVMPTSP